MMDGRTPAALRSRSVLVLAVVVVGSLASLTACNPDFAPSRGIDCRVGVIGDSLMLGTQPSLANELAPVGCDLVFFDAAKNRKSLEGIAALLERDLSGIDILLVGLGTNDYRWPQHMGPMVDGVMRIANGTRVVWVGIGGRIDHKLELNLAILGATTRWENLWYFDWDAEVTAHPEWMGGDGLHLTRETYPNRSRVIARFLGAGS